MTVRLNSGVDEWIDLSETPTEWMVLSRTPTPAGGGNGRALAWVGGGVASGGLEPGPGADGGRKRKAEELALGGEGKRAAQACDPVSQADLWRGIALLRPSDADRTLCFLPC